LAQFLGQCRLKTAESAYDFEKISYRCNRLTPFSQNIAPPHAPGATSGAREVPGERREASYRQALVISSRSATRLDPVELLV
jgi:hypothetical protein